jgi:predicted nucleic acid-binding protein
MRAGQDRYACTQQGRAISTTDYSVAAVVREQGAFVVTGNVKGYPMDDVQLSSLLS